MRLITLAVTTLLLGSCASLHSNDPDALAFSLPKGSTLSLNKMLTISHLNTHAVIQDGIAIKERDRNFYAINCRLDFKDFGPRTIQPEAFKIARTEDGRNWISEPSTMRFYTEVYLTSGRATDVIKMVCQVYGDATDRNFTVAEMQAALGGLVTFKYSAEKTD